MPDFPVQLPAESQPAYDAAVLYFGMGADRSCEAVAQKLTKSGSLIRRWSSQHNWVERSRAYDQAVAQDKAAAIRERYLADLDDHKERYQKAGKALYQVAAELLTALRKDITHMELTPNTLAVVTRAFTVAGDLEAHALGVDQLPERDA